MLKLPSRTHGAWNHLGKKRNISAGCVTLGNDAASLYNGNNSIYFSSFLEGLNEIIYIKHLA